MKDLIDEVHAATRTLSRGRLPAGEANVVTIERTYEADVADVWDAVTDPERIARWFAPVSGDLRQGGTYQVAGNAGGEIRVCDPPHLLRLTWVMGEAGGPDASIVEVRLAATDDGDTTLVLEHTAVVAPEFWDGYGPGAVGVGWDLGVLGLAAHLVGVDLAGDPTVLETDPAMRDAQTASSEAWGAAAAAAGTDPDTVARWTAAVTAFYVPPTD